MVFVLPLWVLLVAVVIAWGALVYITIKDLRARKQERYAIRQDPRQYRR